MATVMYIPEKKQSLGAMKGVMGYVCQEKKPGTRSPDSGLSPASTAWGTMPARNFWLPSAPMARRRA